jgi:aminoglycoside phosphotransferase (APT) family kinase protein
VSDELGIDVEPFGEWIAANVEELTPPFRWYRIGGGHSNLTFGLEDATGARAVVRRPPLGKLQPRAHDMGREFTVISALWPTAVPVARPYAYCEDPDVAGAHFYVMGFVDGRPLDSAETILEWLPTPQQRRTAGFASIEVLAALHTLDVDEIGLGDLAKRDGYLLRQLRAWYRSWEESAADPAGFDDPRAHDIHELLAADPPEQHVARLVHGDYGFHNVLVAADASIAAVVDWELCTLGDPLSDLAYALNRWSIEGDELPGHEGFTMPAGFPSRTEVVERYQQRTGADVSRLDYYTTFNHWRSACIAQGVYTRYVKGQKQADGEDVERFRRMTEQRLARAVAAATSLR